MQVHDKMKRAHSRFYEENVHVLQCIYFMWLLCCTSHFYKFDLVPAVYCMLSGSDSSVKWTLAGGKTCDTYTLVS